MLKVGGQIIQSHSICEATKEGWKQLHQFDLYPDEEANLIIKDSVDHTFSLTSYLPLKLEKKLINNNDDGTGWFVSHYRKTESEISDVRWYKNLNRQLKNSFIKRSSWAFLLENYIFSQDEKQDDKAIPLKLYISENRA